MGIKEDLEAAKANRPEPVLVDIAIGETLYKVEVKRLDGMEWAGIMADAPPTDEASARLGYSPHRAALIACTRHGRLLDGSGTEAVAMGGEGLDWHELFEAISGIEVQAIAASWWALNAGDPNGRVVALKKSLAGGGKTN